VVETRVSRVVDRAYPMVPRDIHLFRLRSITNRSIATAATPHGATSPEKTSKADCKQAVTQFFVRNDSAAIINCTTEPKTGVFFGTPQPIVYRVEPLTVAIFRLGRFESLFHADEPWSTDPSRSDPNALVGL
jgi:hypothetical protein